MTTVCFYSLSFCLFHDQKHIHSLSVFIMTRGLFYFFCFYYDQRFIPLFVFLSLLWSEVYSTLCLSVFIISRGLYHTLSLPFCDQRLIPLFTLQSLLVRFIPHVVSPFLWSEAYSSLHLAVASCEVYTTHCLSLSVIRGLFLSSPCSRFLCLLWTKHLL